MQSNLSVAVLTGAELCSTCSWILFFSCIGKWENTNGYYSPTRRLF